MCKNLNINLIIANKKWLYIHPAKNEQYQTDEWITASKYLISPCKYYNIIIMYDIAVCRILWFACPCWYCLPCDGSFRQISVVAQVAVWNHYGYVSREHLYVPACAWTLHICAMLPHSPNHMVYCSHANCCYNHFKAVRQCQCTIGSYVRHYTVSMPPLRHFYWATCC